MAARSWTRGSRPALFDAHCHIHDARLHAQQQQLSVLRPVVDRAIAANVTHVVSCACFEADWDALEALLACWDRELSRSDPASAGSEVALQMHHADRLRLVMSFGVHPWWAHELRGDYLGLLRAKLAQHPTASLGEIGLCKSSRGRAVELHVQERVFREQLLLAAELSRTCVIHCVGYYGKLLEMLQSVVTVDKSLPPRIVLHSYAGGADLAKAFLTLEKKAPGTKIYFSLNAKQLTDARSDKAAACCAAIPLSALLLETDAPDQAPPVAAIEELCGEGEETLGFAFKETLIASSELNEPALVSVAYRRAAEIRQLSLEELATVVHESSLAAFGLVSVEMSGR